MWFWLAVASAILGTAEVILSKKILNKVSSSVLAWSLFTLSLPPLIYLSFLEGVPALNLFFFIGVFGSSLVFIFSKMIYNNVLRQNLISKILPLTAFSGLFTYIFGLIFLSEVIRPVPVIGLLFIVFGAYILNADQAKEDLLKPFKLLFLKRESLLFLLAVVLGSLTAILDKSALNNTVPTSPIFTILIEQTIMSVMIGAYMLKRESKVWFGQLKSNFVILFLISIIFFLTGLSVFYSYGDGGPVALVMGVKRFQIFLILLMGYLFFKDKPTKHVWIATAIMVFGVLMIKLG
jgi:drug/metabolite transporter (DMT)-like permease